MNENNFKLKKCRCCGRELNKKFFYKTRSECKQCCAKNDTIFFKKHPEKLLFRSAKYRAKKYNIKFDLEKKDIFIPETCPILNIRLKSNLGAKNPADDSASIDRIDNKKGYTKDNIAVISWRANKLKNNGTLEEFEAIIKYIKNNTNNS